MTRNNETDAKKSSKGSMGLLPSMLMIIMTALITCVMLASVLYSVFGTKVYAHIKANEMLPQANYVAAAVKMAMLSNRSELLDVVLQAGGSIIVVLDDENELYGYGEPENDMFQQEQNPYPQHGINPISVDLMDEDEPEINRRYVEYCQNNAAEVICSDEPYISYSRRIGVVVGRRVWDFTGNSVIGTVFLIKPAGEIREATQSVTLALLLSVVVVALLMILPTYSVTRWFVSPVERMSVAALKLADGNFDERVRIEGSYELRELGNSFNTLADKLEENIGSLIVERNRLRAVLDGLGEGIVAVDNSSSITHFNRAAISLLGGREGDLLENLPDYQQVDSAMKAALDGNGGGIIEFSCGGRKLRVNSAVICEENGSIAGAVALISDVTEADRLEQTRRDYVANVSHELRTPLASIRSIADMLNDGLVKSDADKQRYYGYILKESMRLSNLINDLLELSRLQSGGVALKVMPMDLFETVADVADRMSDCAEERGFRIRILPPEGMYRAVSNPDRIDEVLVLLVDNAIKHGDNGTDIDIGIEPRGTKWNVYVENSAHVDEAVLGHLFERFYKADTAHTGEGTGLGLAIAEEVLHLLDESIWVECNDGRIRFTFTVEREKNQLVVLRNEGGG